MNGQAVKRDAIHARLLPTLLSLIVLGFSSTLAEEPDRPILHDVDSNQDLDRLSAPSEARNVFRAVNHYPTDPEWMHKYRKVLSFDSPRVRRTLKLVGNLHELKNCGVTRVTAQIRYSKLGEEEEQNIHLSVVGGEYLVRYRIFSTDIAGGYVYRLVFSHIEEGLLATPWSKRVSNDYIFATLPEALQQDLFDDARDDVVAAARQAMIKSPQ